MVMLTPPRSLRTLKMSSLVQIDATYKFISHEYPVFVVDTLDKNCTFHQFASAREKRVMIMPLFPTCFTYLISSSSPLSTWRMLRKQLWQGLNMYGACVILHKIEKHLNPLSKGGVCGKLKHEYISFNCVVMRQHFNEPPSYSSRSGGHLVVHTYVNLHSTSANSE